MVYMPDKVRFWFVATALMVVLLALAAAACTQPAQQNGALPAEGVVLKRANLRSGPGTSYDIVGSRAPGDRVTISGCNPACDWYQLEDGQWIAAFLVGEVRPRVAPVAESITVLSWNVESGGADARVIGQRLADFQEVDLWGLVEVNSAQDAQLFETAAAVGENSTFAKILSNSGGGDRLLILYDRGRFEELGYEELAYINIRKSVRAPLLVHLRERATGVEFLFMVNHLYRSDDDGRHAQARMLNEWAARQSLPVIAVGDYNFDWDVYASEGQHDAGFDLLVANQRFRWVTPAKLVTTQCTGWPCRYESVLDFVFTAGAAQGWQATSEIVVVAGDFPDTNRTSDHRPLLTRFQFGEAGPMPVAREPAVMPTVGPAKPEPAATSVPAKSNGPIKISLVVIENQGMYEIIGIRNDGATSIDVSGWRLDGSKGDDVCIIPAGVVVQPGQVYEVATGDAQPGEFGYQCREKPIWNNKGETIYLRARDGLVVQIGT
jgi:hypothetical protein